MRTTDKQWQWDKKRKQVQVMHEKTVFEPKTPVYVRAGKPVQKARVTRVSTKVKHKTIHAIVGSSIILLLAGVLWPLGHTSEAGFIAWSALGFLSACMVEVAVMHWEDRRYMKRRR